MKYCEGCDDGEPRFRDPVTGLWCHRAESGFDPHPSPIVCGSQDPDPDVHEGSGMTCTRCR